jgi:hypothetical protein
MKSLVQMTNAKLVSTAMRMPHPGFLASLLVQLLSLCRGEDVLVLLFLGHILMRYIQATQPHLIGFPFASQDVSFGGYRTLQVFHYVPEQAQTA